MKIAFVHPHPDSPHGSERSMHLGAVGLAARGHDTFLIHGCTNTPMVGDAYSDNIGFPELFPSRRGVPKREVLKALDSTLGFIESYRIDVLHIHLLPRAEVLDALISYNRTVVTMHLPFCPTGARYLWDSRRVCERRAGWGCLVHAYARGGCARIVTGQRYKPHSFVRAIRNHARLIRQLNKCRCLISPGEWSKRQLIREGFDADFIRVVAPPVETTHAPSDVKEHGDPIILFVGRLVEFKGPDQVLDASTLIKTPHRVWFIGDGPMRAKLENLASERKLASRVTFFGALPPTELASFRARASVVVIPSLCPETFGMAGAEAMVAGIPAVGYATGGVTEWMHGDSGVVVKPGDTQALAAAIEGLLNDSPRREQMAARGRELAARWSCEKHVLRTEELYRELLDDVQLRTGM